MADRTDEKRVYPHTPGPWRVSEGRHNKNWALISAPRWEDFARVVIRMDGDEMDFATGVANARLIAAAPDLLAACKALMPEGWDEGHMDHMPGIKLARLAIAKAEGRS